MSQCRLESSVVRNQSSLGWNSNAVLERQNNILLLYFSFNLVILISYHSEVAYDSRLLDRYRKALDEAVKVATVHNVSPIRGSTLVFCNVGPAMNRLCTSGKGLGLKRNVSLCRADPFNI